MDLFTNNLVIDCDVESCNYGDTCGAATVISGSDLSFTTFTSPWAMIAKEDVKDGYIKTVCIQCTATNNHIFVNSFTVN